MYCNHTLGVVIPAYNEEGFIGDVIRGMPEYVDRMYVIDDASTDGTWNEILEAAEEDLAGSSSASQKMVSDGGVVSERARVLEQVGRVVPIQHTENTGQGGAVKTGYLVALDEGLDLIAKMDGDGQMDPEQLPRLLDPIVEDKADYSKANRLMNQSYRESMPPFRLFGNAVLTFLTKVSSGYWKMMDPQNGYTVISHHALKNIGVEDLYEYYGYCNDILVKLNSKGMRVADVGMPAIYGDEESSISYPTYIRKVSIMLLRNFLWRLKVRYIVIDFHPLSLFYLFGISTIGISILSGIWSIYAKISFDNSLFLYGAVTLLIFLTGSTFVMFAMLFDMQANKDREIQIFE